MKYVYLLGIVHSSARLWAEKGRKRGRNEEAVVPGETQHGTTKLNVIDVKTVQSKTEEKKRKQRHSNSHSHPLSLDLITLLSHTYRKKEK